MSGAAAIYVRVSSKGQEDNASLSTQEAACRAFASDTGYALDEEHIYKEVHTGAELWERPQLTALRDAMRRGEVGVVICFAVDRLAREQTHFSILLDEADRVGAEFLFVTEKFENTPVGKMVLSVKSFAAELEREKIRERTMRGKLARVQGGRLAGNTPAPFGLLYSDDKSRYVAKEPEASVVRRIFTMAATGGTTRRIQMTLNEEGVPAPRGGQWCHRTIAAVLSNEVYTGRVEWRKSHTKKEHGKITRTMRPDEERVQLADVAPVLVSPDLFAAVRARLERNKSEAARRCANPELYLLRGGYVRDAETGRALTARAHRQGRFHSYQHMNGTGVSKGKYLIKATTIDELAWEFVTHLLSNPSIIEREIAVAGSGAGDANLDAIEDGLAKVRRRQGNIAAALALVDEEDARQPLVAQLRSLADQRKMLEAERENALTQQKRWEALRARLDQLPTVGAEVLAAMDYHEKRQWLAALGFVAFLHRTPDGPQLDVACSIPLPDGGEQTIAYRSTAITPMGRRRLGSAIGSSA